MSFVSFLRDPDDDLPRVIQKLDTWVPCRVHSQREARLPRRVREDDGCRLVGSLPTKTRRGPAGAVDLMSAMALSRSAPAGILFAALSFAMSSDSRTVSDRSHTWKPADRWPLDSL
jgi:hypothetical protein